MSQHTVKAVRATIQLGMISLEVFQLPNGEYRLSQTQVAEAVGKHRMAVLRFLESNSPEALPYKDFRCHRTRIEGNNASIHALPIEIATAYWGKEALAQNTSAVMLLIACAAEAIERRADAAFGVRRDEEERDERFKARMQGKRVRRSFTDAIADYLKRHPELSEDCREWIYVNSSEAVNKVVFGKRAWELRNERDADRHSLRDSFTAQELLLVQEVEDVATRLVDHEDKHPPTAVRLAGDRLLLSHCKQVPIQSIHPRKELTGSRRRR